MNKTKRYSVMAVVLVVVLGTGIFWYVMAQDDSDVQAATCENYPEYCVPLAGGGPELVDGQANLVESEAVRELEAESTAAEGVVRGMTYDGTLFIGDPDAPVHFLEFGDFACPHCQNYHPVTKDLIDEAVLTGQATYQTRSLTFVAGAYSYNAAEAMLCAGEQGAAWEMYDHLLESGKRDGAKQAFDIDMLADAAGDMGLDAGDFEGCLLDTRYDALIAGYSESAQALGVRSTPTVLVRYGDSGAWTIVEDNSLDGLLALVAAAQGDAGDMGADG